MSGNPHSVAAVAASDPFAAWASEAYSSFTVWPCWAAWIKSTTRPRPLMLLFPPASPCSLQDQNCPEGQPSPLKETQAGKRPRPQHVLEKVRGEEESRLGQGLGSGKIASHALAGGMGWGKAPGAEVQTSF